MSCYDLPFCLVRLFGTHCLGAAVLNPLIVMKPAALPLKDVSQKHHKTLRAAIFSEEILFFTRYVSMKGFVFLLQIYRFIAEIICNQKVIR